MSARELVALPEALPLLSLAPLAWLALRANERGRAERLARLAGPRARVLAAELGTSRRRLGRWLLASGLLMALLAVSQPTFGETADAAEPRGADLLVCLDVSRSMLARDVEPSRLGRARIELRALAERARGERMGLIAFAGEARMLVPFTRDLASFAELAGLADEHSVRRGGSELGAALEAALAVLERRPEERAAAVLLFSDGEDHGGRGIELARRFRERGVALHCVGFGSPLGSKIPIDEGGGERFLRDRAGREVVTALDPIALARIAEAGGGELVDAGARPRALVDLYERRVLPLARRAAADEERRRANRFQWPLLVALLCCTAELALSDRRRR